LEAGHEPGGAIGNSQSYNFVYSAAESLRSAGLRNVRTEYHLLADRAIQEGFELCVSFYIFDLYIRAGTIELGAKGGDRPQ
jgi:hypothetical protein